MVARIEHHKGELFPRVEFILTNLRRLAPLRDKLIKLGAKVVTHARHLIFQMAELAIPRPPNAAAAIIGADLGPQEKKKNSNIVVGASEGTV